MYTNMAAPQLCVRVRLRPKLVCPVDAHPRLTLSFGEEEMSSDVLEVVERLPLDIRELYLAQYLYCCSHRH